MVIVGKRLGRELITNIQRVFFFEDDLQSHMPEQHDI